VLPGMQGIFLKLTSRDLEIDMTMRGGVKQGRKPSWNFTGRLSIIYGNRRGPNDPVRSPELAKSEWMPHHGDPVG
jgi:hypothetical protein